MHSNDIFALGLGLTPPWKLIDQRLDMDKNPHELHLRIEADRGSLYPCPECGQMCKSHDFKELTWRHLNFFQLLFEQVAMTLVREMPVLVAARNMEVTDNRLWRIISYYVNKAMSRMDLGGLQAFSLDETKAKRGHRYVTTFIDLDRTERPVVFATPGKGKDTVVRFKKFLKEHGGKPENVVEVVSDMSGAFISAVKGHFNKARITVDWFHMVQLFSRAVDEVRRAEAKEIKMPKTTRWAVLKGANNNLTEKQIDALAELAAMDLHTSTAWRIKEALRWVRQAIDERKAAWRLNWFIKYAKELIAQESMLAPIRKAIKTVEKHKQAILSRWHSGHSNARLEGLNSLFQAAKARARGYRNTDTFINMIYLIAAPIKNLLVST